MNNENNTSKFEELNAFLKYAKQGFAIFTTYSSYEQNNVLDKIEVDFIVYDCILEEFPTTDKVLKWVENKKDSNVIIIKNMQLLFENDDEIRKFNYTRERFLKEKKIFLFGMLEQTEEKFFKKAFDFHTIIRVIMRFEKFNSQFLNSDIELGNTNFNEQKEYKATLERYLKIYNDVKDDDAYIEANTEEYFNICYRIGKLYYSYLEIRKSLEFFTRCYELFNNKFNNKVYLCDTLNAFGNCYLLLHDNDTALKYYNDSLMLASEIYGKDSEYSAIIYINMGIIFSHENNSEKALEYYNKAKNILNKDKAKNILALMGVNHRLMIEYTKMGQYEEALMYSEGLLEFFSSHYGENSIENIFLYINVAGLYFQIGKLDKALEYCNKCLNMAESNFAENNILYSYIYNILGAIYFEEKQLEQSKIFNLKALDILRENFGEDNSEYLKIQKNIEIIDKKILEEKADS